jgi:hypothetical protein
MTICFYFLININFLPLFYPFMEDNNNILIVNISKMFQKDKMKAAALF